MKLIALLLSLMVCANGGVINNDSLEFQNLDENDPPMLSIQEVMDLVDPDTLKLLKENEKNTQEMMDMDFRDLHPDIQYDSKAKTVSYNYFIEVVGIGTLIIFFCLARFNKTSWLSR